MFGRDLLDDNRYGTTGGAQKVEGKPTQDVKGNEGKESEAKEGKQRSREEMGQVKIDRVIYPPASLTKD